jgi:hypothetical protein
VPQKLTEKHWFDIAQSPTLRHRFEILKFAHHVEKRKQVDERLKKQRSVKYAEPRELPDIEEEYDLFRFISFEGLSKF